MIHYKNPSIRERILVVFILLLCSFNAHSQSTILHDTKGSDQSDNQKQENVVFSEAELSLMKSHGPWPIDVPADPGNEFSGLEWAEKLGEQLFNDKHLSLNNSISCASCHVAEKAFSDNLPTAIGTQDHVRNTQGLFDIGLQRWFGWDGGTDSLWAAGLRAMLSEIEMAGNVPDIAKWLREESELPAAFNAHTSVNSAELNDEELVVASAKTIAAYTRSLRSGQTQFDRFLKALLTRDSEAISEYPAAAKRGLKLFLGEANCQVCHFGPNFSNGEFHDTGQPFFTAVGQVDPGRYTGIERVRTDKFNLLGPFNGNVQEEEQNRIKRVTLGQTNWGQWRTPSLRNLTLTAPYMHDGSIATLREVIDAYADIDPNRLHTNGESILKPLSLSNDQRNDLVEFLISLSP